MNDQERMNRIIELLGQFKTPRDLDWLIEFLEKKIIQDEEKLERQKKYFQKNKEERYKYHKHYRETHPEYEEKRRQNAREQKKN